MVLIVSEIGLGKMLCVKGEGCGLLFCFCCLVVAVVVWDMGEY
jgi:hypothetical protein